MFYQTFLAVSVRLGYKRLPRLRDRLDFVRTVLQTVTHDCFIIGLQAPLVSGERYTVRESDQLKTRQQEGSPSFTLVQVLSESGLFFVTRSESSEGVVRSEDQRRDNESERLSVIER